MKNKIKDNIGNPEQLEQLYRADKKGFEKAFLEIYPQISDYTISDFWKTRLEFKSEKEEAVRIKRKDILLLIVACLVTGLLIKIPQLFDIDLVKSFFYEKNTGLITLFGLSLYAFLTKDALKIKHVLISAAVFIVSAIYINILPSTETSDSVVLAFIHLPLMIWCLYGLIFIDFDSREKIKRMDYIKYNGDLAVLLALIAIAGGILTALTIGLFSAIEINIEDFYFEHIVIWGLVSAPIVATYIVRKFPFVVNNIAPIIANIFSPLVLITLIIYLVSIPISGKDPYNDRDFLIVFNLMLLGVMAIIVFSVSEISIKRKQRFTERILLALTIVTLIIDLVALSAIVYRLGEFGFTPNRTVVLGSNLLIFGNLILILIDLYRVNFKNKKLNHVELTIARYLPVYAVWTIFVVFGLPLLYGLK
ncbi:MAG: DUF4153 domain-containing protein [Flavobacteriaceae bacterium]|nr:DUF4153 domain-containing protein [Bacteroidia bacterium]NNF75265.1 DUF4153 domain-containing protein [Flavobacteriaceae bacterium]